MKKGQLILAGTIIFLGVLTGCGEDGKQAEKEKTKDGRTIVEFWSFWGSETRGPVIEKIIKDFNDSQDQVFVKHTFLPWGDIWTKNLASVKAGNPGDVIINDINSVALRAENKQVEDLSKYLDNTFQERFYPNLWETVLHDSKPYAVPFNTDTRLLFYNKTAFREAGLDPNKPPETWTELEHFAKKLDDIKQK
ncbi:extracellular solute-binding protein [Mesobacillus zeae]|uniref:Extracellular solute-binding protein n=1 Tax=Mesobacillus zeae TaxID=1917180 RepID=A0A398BDS6_9BACI|nr:extracellular solute-binding protein [Mesobacillus zeae]RID87774.1 extracellular solute-binding protein [Mesobacillus zeae]